MPVYYFGFNGFKQIPDCEDECIFIKELKVLDNEWSKMSLSWNSVSRVHGENKLTFHGFFEGLQIDTEAKNINRAVICDKFVVITTNARVGKVYQSKDASLVEVKQIELNKDKFIDCHVGESSALFINEAGKAVRVHLKPTFEEFLLPLAWKVVEVSCGKEHALVLNENGTVFSFGQGSRGQLGHGIIENDVNLCLVECLEGIPVQHIAAGGWHSAAVTKCGDLFTWGWNESGQLGLPTTRKSPTALSENSDETVSVQALPTCVQFDDDVSIITVSCGSRHTLAISENGQLWAFGWNAYGQLGINPALNFESKPTPVKVFANELVTDVRCGGWSSLVLTTKL